MNKTEETNIILTGVGGQGQVTLLRLLGEAGKEANIDLKSSELHGLSQKGGSVRVHLRLGEEIYSPLVAQGDADLILGLERQEALASAKFSSDDTYFLINDHQTPTMAESASKEEIEKELSQISDQVDFIDANKLSKEDLGNPIVAGVVLTAYACTKDLIPISTNGLKEAIEELMEEKHIDLNLKAVELGKELAQE